MGYKIGAAKTEMTFFRPGVDLFGWVHFSTQARGIESRLYCRTFVIESRPDGKKIALVTVDIGVVTQLLKQEISYRLQENHPELGIDDANLLITATHTHAAPAGFSESILYNIPSKGTNPEVLEHFVKKIVASIVAADRNKKPAEIRYAAGAFADSVPVVFNRAYQAFNLNAGIDEAVTKSSRHLAADRNMYLLRFDGLDSRPIGTLNWFGIHATTMKRDTRCVSSDNKGFAAEEMEKKLGGGTVCAFSQGAAGDLTPNIQRHLGKIGTMGPSRDAVENRKISGRMQCDQALALYAKARAAPALAGEVDFRLNYHEMNRVDVDPEFTDGQARQTGNASLGTGLILGTDEGPGAARPILWLANMFTAFWKRTNGPVHGKKNLLIDLVTRNVVGFSGVEKIPVPRGIHPIYRLFYEIVHHPFLSRRPLVPQTMPTQLFVIGPVALLALPAEPTTMVGRRMRKTLAGILQKRGVKDIVLTGYSNAYSGYITTPEEYELQRYEGAHTLFGKWTAPAYQTVAKELAYSLLNGAKKESSLRSATRRPERLNPTDLAIQ